MIPSHIAQNIINNVWQQMITDITLVATNTLTITKMQRKVDHCNHSRIPYSAYTHTYRVTNIILS